VREKGRESGGPVAAETGGSEGTPFEADITIAIPFYTGQAYLREAIESVLAQDSARWLLIVVDDHGPEHGTRALVESYGDARISYQRNEHNLGMAGNWNRCIENARSPLVTLLHSDDRLLPGYVRQMTEAHERHPDAVIVHSRARIIDDEGRPKFSLADSVKRLTRPRPTSGWYVTAGEDGARRLMLGNFVMCPTCCYRVDRLPAAPFEPRWKMVLDLDLLIRLVFQGNAIVGTVETLYEYRRHAMNATERYTESLLRFEEEVALYDEVAAEANSYGWRRAGRVARAKRIIKLNLVYRTGADLVGGRWQAAASKWRYLTRLVRADVPSTF
jgi:glycosyltransferase involved in cell wall biosynthesis